MPAETPGVALYRVPRAWWGCRVKAFSENAVHKLPLEVIEERLDSHTLGEVSRI